MTIDLCRGYDDIEIDCESPAEEIRDYRYKIVIPRSISKPSVLRVITLAINTTSIVNFTTPLGVYPSPMLS